RRDRRHSRATGQAAPTASYTVRIRAKGGGSEDIEVHNPADLPDMGQVLEIKEPICRVEIMLPNEYIGDIMKLCLDRRGIYKSQQVVGDTRQMLTFQVPLA